jgi:hypothetical protein
VPGEPQVEWRVLNVNPQTGDMTIIGRSGGEYMVVRMNAGTLDGEVLHPRTGQVVQIRSGFVTIPEARLGGSADASAKTPGADNRPAPVAALPSAQAQIAPPPAATPEAIELHRQVLGTDPSVGGRFRANEADTALRVEAHRRIVLDRFSPAGPNEKGDWFNVANPTEVFDGCSPPRSAFFDLQLANGNYETSLQDHLAHPTVTFVVIDITGLGLSAAQEAALDALILRVAGPNNPKILRIP